LRLLLASRKVSSVADPSRPSQYLGQKRTSVQEREHGDAGGCGVRCAQDAKRPEDQARAAAEEIAAVNKDQVDLRGEFASLRGEFSTVKWMLGTLVVLIGGLYAVIFGFAINHAFH
jgi:hypothetical protein